MKKLIILTSLSVFAVASAFAGSCGGGKCEEGKKGDKKKEPAKESYAPSH